MALKMLYRGPSSRLETLIEKIQQNKDSSPDIDSSNTSPSYSPSLPDMASTPNFEMDNLLNINNNNKITAKQHQERHSVHSPSEDGGINGNILPEISGKQGKERKTLAMRDIQNTPSDTGVEFSPINNTIKTLTQSHDGQSPTTLAKSKGENFRLGKFGKMNGTTLQLPSNAANSNVEGSYHCQFCDKSFPRLGYLKKHEQSHAEHMPFKCEYCARLFKHKRSRDRHTKLHTGDRRYRCPHCESAFSRSDHLKIHMKTHDNQKPFQCTVCNRGYNTAAALTSHMQSHKKQAALQRNSTFSYSPRSTGSASSSNSLYKRKYSPHIDQRDNQNQSSILAVNVKRFAYHRNSTSLLYCIYCTKNDFENLEQLHVHVQQMHAPVLREATTSPFSGIQPGLPLSCEFCTMKFPSISGMFQHIRSMHMDRISNPSLYMEHMGRRAIGFGDANENYGRKSNEIFVHPLEYSKSDDIRSTQNNLKEERDHLGDKSNENEANAKQAIENSEVKEEEDLPTDLSNKRTDSKNSNNCDDSIGVNHSVDTYADLKRLQKISSDLSNAIPDPLQCRQCGLIFSTIEEFHDHLRNHLVHGETQSYVCFQCGVTSVNQTEYELHVSSHFLLTSKEYTCAFGCNKHFASSDDLQKHLFAEHATNLWKCGICSEIFESKMAIQIHFAMAHSNKEDTFRCSACMELFETENEFKNHVRTKHSLMFSLPNLQCPLCRTVCSSELEMHFHMATHSRQYHCTLCPETFHLEFLLERHLQMHHCLPEKESLTSYKIDNLNNDMFHYNYAAAKKLYPFCSASGSSKLFDPLNIQSTSSTSSLKLPPPLYELYDNIGKSFSQHRLSKNLSHISKSFSERLDLSKPFAKRFTEHTTENLPFLNLYKPGYTSKMFLKSNSMVYLPSTSSESHKINDQSFADKKKSAETLLRCNICERNDFQNELEILTHQKIAHNIKTGVSLMCAYCNDNFRSRSELETHMKSAHTGGKHKCLICDEVFPTADILAEHKLNHSKMGVRGKCTYCSANLLDVQGFKSHMTEHGNAELPVQCICCRQTLSSSFEIELHAKFHVIPSSSECGEEKNCALCLCVLPSNSESKICKMCFEKHNTHGKSTSHSISKRTGLSLNEDFITAANSLPEHYCNLCKTKFSTTTELEEHLIEHSFRGCEERGYSCYICSAIFTLPCGLHQHMIEHGPSYQPYDCNQCAKKFYFRAELENHLINHETGRVENSTELDAQASISQGLQQVIIKNESNQTRDSNDDTDNENDTNSNIDIKFGDKQYLIEANDDEDDEYIEVEQIAENASVGEGCRKNIQETLENNDQQDTMCEENRMNNGQ